MKLTEVISADERMDHRDFTQPLNKLNPKCAACGFPDLECVPQPYYVIKSRTMTPNELAGAEVGNFLVRGRVKSVLELVASGQCTFVETCYLGTTQASPWFLAVPTNQVVAGVTKPSIPRCKRCGEPRSSHPGSQWAETLFGERYAKRGRTWTDESKFDILKSATWASSEDGWDKWLNRPLYLSVRLLHLFKRIGAKGFRFYEADSPKEIPLAPEDRPWVEEKLAQIEAAGIPLQPQGIVSKADAEWFRSHLKENARKSTEAIDVKSIERRLKTKLPKSYLEFMEKVGSKTFENVENEEGMNAELLPPAELHIDEIEDWDDKSNPPVPVLTFADNGHGDCWCFDMASGLKEPPVLFYLHEVNRLEPFADNFAACIKRFAAANA